MTLVTLVARIALTAVIVLGAEVILFATGHVD